MEQIAEEEMSEGVRVPVVSALQRQGPVMNESEALSASRALQLLEENLRETGRDR